MVAMGVMNMTTGDLPGGHLIEVAVDTLLAACLMVVGQGDIGPGRLDKPVRRYHFVQNSSLFNLELWTGCLSIL